MKANAKFPPVASPRGIGGSNGLNSTSITSHKGDKGGYQAKKFPNNIRFGSMLDEDSMVRTSKHPINDDMIQGSLVSKKPEIMKPTAFASPRAKRNNNVSAKPISATKKLSEIDNLYESLRSLAQSNLQSNSYRNTGFQMQIMDSIHLGEHDVPENK